MSEGSWLEIYVRTYLDDEGGYNTKAFVQANDPNPSVRAAQYRAGADMAALSSSAHTNAIENGRTQRYLARLEQRLLEGGN